LKTLGGLLPVDVVFRRLGDGYCDPLELRNDPSLGVAGLLQAVRAGNVAVANVLGSSLVESAAFIPFLPGLCRQLLGEDLKLPSVATWWSSIRLPSPVRVLPAAMARSSRLVAASSKLCASSRVGWGPVAIGLDPSEFPDRARL